LNVALYCRQEILTLDEERYVGHPHTSSDGRHYSISIPNRNADSLGGCLLKGNCHVEDVHVKTDQQQGGSNSQV
jgi:hypothetical protein